MVKQKKKKSEQYLKKKDVKHTNAERKGSNVARKFCGEVLELQNQADKCSTFSKDCIKKVASRVK